MNMKEKCIYYNPKKDYYYIVLSISDMIYGRRGYSEEPGFLKYSTSNTSAGLRFKVGNLIFDCENIRNYFFDEDELNDFVFVKELTDGAFSLIEVFSETRVAYPAITISTDESINSTTLGLIEQIKVKEAEKIKIQEELKKLERKLFDACNCSKLL